MDRLYCMLYAIHLHCNLVRANANGAAKLHANVPQQSGLDRHNPVEGRQEATICESTIGNALGMLIGQIRRLGRLNPHRWLGEIDVSTIDMIRIHLYLLCTS